MQTNANECKQLNIPCDLCNEEIFTDETSLLVNNVVCCICKKMCCSNCIQKNKHGQYICSLCNQTTCEFCTKCIYNGCFTRSKDAEVNCDACNREFCSSCISLNSHGENLCLLCLCSCNRCGKDTGKDTGEENITRCTTCNRITCIDCLVEGDCNLCIYAKHREIQQCEIQQSQQQQQHEIQQQQQPEIQPVYTIKQQDGTYLSVKEQLQIVSESESPDPDSNSDFDLLLWG